MSESRHSRHNGPRIKHLVEEGAPYETITVDPLTPNGTIAPTWLAEV